MKQATLLVLVFSFSSCAAFGNGGTHTPEERCGLARDALAIAEANLEAAKRICSERSACDAIPYVESAYGVALETQRALCVAE